MTYTKTHLELELNTLVKGLKKRGRKKPEGVYDEFMTSIKYPITIKELKDDSRITPVTPTSLGVRNLPDFEEHHHYLEIDGNLYEKMPNTHLSFIFNKNHTWNIKLKNITQSSLKYIHETDRDAVIAHAQNLADSAILYNDQVLLPSCGPVALIAFEKAHADAEANLWAFRRYSDHLEVTGHRLSSLYLSPRIMIPEEYINGFSSCITSAEFFNDNDNYQMTDFIVSLDNPSVNIGDPFAEALCRKFCDESTNKIIFDQSLINLAKFLFEGDPFRQNLSGSYNREIGLLPINYVESLSKYRNDRDYYSENKEDLADLIKNIFTEEYIMMPGRGKDRVFYNIMLSSRSFVEMWKANDLTYKRKNQLNTPANT